MSLARTSKFRNIFTRSTLVASIRSRVTFWGFPVYDPSPRVVQCTRITGIGGTHVASSGVGVRGRGVCLVFGWVDFIVLHGEAGERSEP